MSPKATFVDRERQRAASWKVATAALPDQARIDAPYVGKASEAGKAEYPFCLPPEFADHNLLPEVREDALKLFGVLGIPWHASVDGGPSNHLLSSQVQCVNALGQMVADRSRIELAFGQVLDIAEVLEVEPGRYLTFEYIGEHDYFGEGAGRSRTRGANCTSVDAAFSYRDGEGLTHLALIEWKYTESYRRRTPAAAKDAERRRRYESTLLATDGPIRTDLLPFEAFLDEPLYQLMRQQLLAHRTETDPRNDFATVRVIHVLNGENAAYNASLHSDEAKGLGSTVDEVWTALLRTPDRFVHLDPAVFLDPAITSAEYDARYG